MGIKKYLDDYTDKNQYRLYILTDGKNPDHTLIFIDGEHFSGIQSIGFTADVHGTCAKCDMSFIPFNIDKLRRTGALNMEEDLNGKVLYETGMKDKHIQIYGDESVNDTFEDELRAALLESGKADAPEVKEVKPAELKELNEWENVLEIASNGINADTQITLNGKRLGLIQNFSFFQEVSKQPVIKCTKVIIDLNRIEMPKYVDQTFDDMVNEINEP